MVTEWMSKTTCLPSPPTASPHTPLLVTCMHLDLYFPHTLSRQPHLDLCAQAGRNGRGGLHSGRRVDLRERNGGIMRQQ